MRGALAGRRAPWEPGYSRFQKDRKWANIYPQSAGALFPPPTSAVLRILAAKQRPADLAAKLVAFEAEQQSMDEARHKLARGADRESVEDAGRAILEQLCAHVDQHMVKLCDAFAKIDSDGSRALDRTEWARFLAATDCVVPGEVAGSFRAPTEAEIAVSWSKLDIDGDGEVGFGDLILKFA